MTRRKREDVWRQSYRLRSRSFQGEQEEERESSMGEE
jgi:hypothetical protein